MPTEKLSPPLILSANPEAYDYIHSFSLFESGAIELIAGDGQKIWFKARGSFQWSPQQDWYQLRVTDLACEDDDDFLPENHGFECKATIEYGQYLLPDGLPIAQVPEKSQYLLFTRRVVFDTDPILLASTSGDVVGRMAHDETERIYYLMNEGRRGALSELNRPQLIL